MNASNLATNQNNASKRSMKDILPSTFFIMKCCGLWEPFDLNACLKVFYTAYRIVLLLSMVTVGISMVCVILFTTKGTSEVFVENSFLLFTLFSSCVKALILLLKRQDIKLLLKVLLEDQCQPLDSAEQEIQTKFDKSARNFTLRFSTLVGICVTAYSMEVVFCNEDERIEILNVWRPYNLKVHLYFWITWIHECLGHIVTAGVHIAVDTLISGLMIQLSCQLKFLRHRLNKFPRRFENTLNAGIGKGHISERSLISLTVRHQNTIYELAKKLNEVFKEVLFTQVLISLMVICFSVFNISKGRAVNYSTQIMLYSYTGCMLFQLFLYCFYGNELMIYSTDLQDAVSETNWLYFENETKKSLIILMNRSRKPILISACSVIPVNLDSFVSIVRTSYSAYNVLKDSV